MQPPTDNREINRFGQFLQRSVMIKRDWDDFDCICCCLDELKGGSTDTNDQEEPPTDKTTCMEEIKHVEEGKGVVGKGQSDEKKLVEADQRSLQ